MAVPTDGSERVVNTEEGPRPVCSTGLKELWVPHWSSSMPSSFCFCIFTYVNHCMEGEIRWAINQIIGAGRMEPGNVGHRCPHGTLPKAHFVLLLCSIKYPSIFKCSYSCIYQKTMTVTKIGRLSKCNRSFTFRKDLDAW